jgi:hypothetical protein
MMKSKLVFSIFLAATIGFTACQKNEGIDTTGPSSMGVKITAVNKSYSLPVSNGTKSAVITNASITWDTVQMVVSQIKFEAELKSLVTHRDSIGISYRWSGPKLVNLLDSNLMIGDFMLQPGFYDEIELKVYGNKEDAGTMPVFYMYGNYTSTQNSIIPVAVKVYNDVQFKTEKDSVTVTGESIDITSYVRLYLDKLLVGIDPQMLDDAKLTNGVIVISANSNSEIYFTLMQNLVKNHKCYYQYKGQDNNNSNNKNKDKDKDKHGNKNKDKGDDD